MNEKKKGFQESEIKSIMFQTLSGLAFMHKSGFSTET